MISVVSMPLARLPTEAVRLQVLLAAASISPRLQVTSLPFMAGCSRSVAASSAQPAEETKLSPAGSRTLPVTSTALASISVFCTWIVQVSQSSNWTAGTSVRETRRCATSGPMNSCGTMLRSTSFRINASWLALLLLVLSSCELVEAEAVLVMRLCSGAVSDTLAANVQVRLWSLSMLSSSQVTWRPCLEWLRQPDTLRSTVAAAKSTKRLSGRVKRLTTPSALCGPALVTAIVQVLRLPLLTSAGADDTASVSSLNRMTGTSKVTSLSEGSRSSGSTVSYTLSLALIKGVGPVTPRIGPCGSSS